jgi:hypothetical protein
MFSGSTNRHRFLQIRRKVVLSPGRDDKGDYLNVNDRKVTSLKEEVVADPKRLKQMVFETYLE